jgi:hypothetical protein
MPGLPTASDFRNMSVDEIYAKLDELHSPNQYQMAVEELQRKYLMRVGEQVDSLNNSSQRMEWMTKALIALTIALVVESAALLLPAVHPTKSDLPSITTYTVNKAWVQAARNWGWTGLSAWTDESILRNLSTPSGFRAGFPEYGTWNDEEIGEIAAQVPPIPYVGYPPGHKFDPTHIEWEHYQIFDDTGKVKERRPNIPHKWRQ